MVGHFSKQLAAEAPWSDHSKGKLWCWLFVWHNISQGFRYEILSRLLMCNQYGSPWCYPLPKSFWTFGITQSWIFKPQHASLSHPRTVCELKKNTYPPTCSQRGKTIMGDFWGSRPLWDTVRPITVWEGMWIYRVCIYVYMYICIHIYMYICIYVYMYICIYVYMYMYICIYVYMYIGIYVYMYICIYTYMYICIYAYAYMHICIYVYMYICIYAYTYICIYVCIHIYVYMYICMYIYICIHVYMYICIYRHVYMYVMYCNVMQCNAM